MRRFIIALALWFGLVGGAAAQEMQVFVAQDALDTARAEEVVKLLGEAFPQAQWTLLMQSETGKSLRDLVLADCAPQLAIAAPGELTPWAKEGLLLELTGAIRGQRRFAPQALAACVQDERLMLLPLRARHRQMAVNCKQMEAQHLSYLLDDTAYPVWYATQLYQVLEEFMLDQQVAMEIWPPRADGEAIEALVQAIYGGELLLQDGETCGAASKEMHTGVAWLSEMVRCGMIGMAADRETALRRFVNGETALFLDWDESTAAQYAGEMETRGVELRVMPYPSSAGACVRAFEPTCAAAFAGEAPMANLLAVKATAFLHEDAQAQRVLGERAIWQDDALWLAPLSANARGTTLRALFASALEDVLMDDLPPETALCTVQAAMDAMQ